MCPQVATEIRPLVPGVACCRGQGKDCQKWCVRKRKCGKHEGVCAKTKSKSKLFHTSCSQTFAHWTINWTTFDSSGPHSGNLETAASLFSQKHGSVTEFWTLPFSYMGSPHFVLTEMQLCVVRLKVVAYVSTSAWNGARTQC